MAEQTSLIEVVAHRSEWADQFRAVAAGLDELLAGVPHHIEHVGSTSVPGLPAKPILDVDVVVAAEDVPTAMARLVGAGYRHEGDYGLTGRDSFIAPDESPRRNVYLCVDGSVHLRNHLAVREVLRRDAALRDEYGRVKMALAGSPGMTMPRYVTGKSEVLQRVLAVGGLGDEERALIFGLNDHDAPAEVNDRV